MQADRPMVGRASESAALRAALRQAESGDARIVIVGGEAGIGKTRLIHEFTSTLSDEVALARGQCAEFGSVGIPYVPIAGILRDLTARLGEDAVFEAAAGGVTLLRALVELRAPAERDERLGVVRLDEVVTTVLERLAGNRTVVVVVEDLHWADRATLDTLRFLSRMLRTARLLVLVSYRSDDVGRRHPLRPFLAELERTPRVQRLLLERLSPDEVAQQARTILGSDPDPRTAAELVERSEGVPFFVEELLACGADAPVHATLHELLLARYDALPTDVQAVVRAAAAAGGRVNHDILAEVCGISSEALDDALRTAIDGGVLAVAGRGYDFRHALVREAVAGELLPGESVRIHARYARAIESRTGDPGRRAARAVLLSSHWLAAHALDEAFRTAVEGLRLSRASFAHATAAQLGERALDLWDRVAEPASAAGMTHLELLLLTALSWRSAGESHRALATIDQALAQVPADDASTRARLLRHKGMMIDVEGRADALALYEEALELVSAESDPGLRAAILAEAASKYMISGRYERALASAAEALALAAPDAARTRSMATNIRATTLVHTGRIDEGIAGFAQALEAARGDRDAVLRYHVNYSDALHLLGRFDEAMAVALDGARIAAEIGVARTSGAILALNSVDPLFALGRWDRADELIAEALATQPPAVFGVYLRRARIRSVMWRGDPEGARALFEGWKGDMLELADFEDQVAAGLAHDIGDLHLALGDLDAAWQWAGALVTRDRLAATPWVLPIAPIAARIIARRREALGDPAHGTDHADRLHEIVARDPWPTQRLWQNFARAELGGPSGSGDDVALWEAAAEAARIPEAPVLTRLQIGLGLARALTRSGDRAGAARTLEQLRSQASGMGAGLVVAWADDLADAAGIRGPARRADAGTDELTARERQVLDLIAEGPTNGQIADRLYISRKTVSVHVSAVLRKLGASSRTEAARIRLAGA